MLEYMASSQIWTNTGIYGFHDFLSDRSCRRRIPTFLNSNMDVAAWEVHVQPVASMDQLRKSDMQVAVTYMKMKKMAILNIVLLFATINVVLSVNDGLLPNGNFEQGPKASQMKGTKVTDPHAIPHWEISGYVEYIKAGQTQGDMLLPVPEGAFAVRLGEDASIKTRVVTVSKGTFYSLSFNFARTCAQEEKLNVSVSPNTEPNDWGMLPMQTMYSSDAIEKDPACGPLIDFIALKALRNPHRLQGNMLKNGNFEEGPYIFPNTSWGVLIPPNIEDDHSPLPGWIIQSLKAVKYIDAEHFTVPEGKCAIELVAGRESAIAQIVRTQKGKIYDLMFSVGDASNSCQGSMLIEAFAGQITLRVPYESTGNGGFKRAKLRFKAVSERTRVRFLSAYYHMKNDHSGSLCGPVVDDVRLVGVRHP
ncbi:hypothetical protein RND71_017192 [Anisodus tanguticus]|uniref:DUF642 domain-containing protein n=1 Tax=Anisodus tanguticus TaxID=243964 RepID=A0AAE1S1V6_9SOLA|nr:hypothetical protein RND71_017192 [Anisodus tanguticus]